MRRLGRRPGALTFAKLALWSVLATLRYLISPRGLACDQFSSMIYWVSGMGKTTIGRRSASATALARWLTHRNVDWSLNQKGHV